MTTWSSSLRCVSAAMYYTAKLFSKTGKITPRKHLTRGKTSWKTRQDFLKLPSLREAALRLNSHLGIKCHPHFIKVIRFLQHSSTQWVITERKITNNNWERWQTHPLSSSWCHWGHWHQKLTLNRQRSKRWFLVLVIFFTFCQLFAKKL